ncbi:MAG: ATP-binding protein [Nanobdellota archaeon]
MVAYGIAGGPCSGKTTLIQALAGRVNHTILTEYATEFILSNGGIRSASEQLHISLTQKKRELGLRQRGHPFITECTIFAGLVYHAENFPHTVEEMYAEFFDMDMTYETVFWLEHLGFYEENGIRYQKDMAEARRIGERLYREAFRFAREVHVIPVMPVQERVEMILRLLAPRHEETLRQEQP